MITSRYFIGAAVIGLGAVTFAAMNRPTHELVGETNGEKPNVIVVLLDDLGSSDIGFSGSYDIPTPNIDRIAEQGVACSNAYISAPYSGPSRCGIMTGRYQQRFGAEGNSEATELGVEQKQGVLESEVLLSNIMKEQGYATCAIGKWHLGDHYDLLPNQRGFDYFYGFSSGSFNFWGTPDPKNPLLHVQENGRVIPASEQTYLTDDFTQKTVDFIEQSTKSEAPFFIYLAYNAPHAPLQVTEKYLKRTQHIANAERSVYAAMILAVDDGIGRIWNTLEKNHIDDNTMIIFLSDNGGVGNPGRATNVPGRAFKGNMFDGGIKTPFAIYWKGHLQPGLTYDKTISALDIFPTVAKAAGFDPADNKNSLDGVDLMPYLTNHIKSAPHDKLFWRVCGGLEYAMRQGDYKLVKTHYDDNYQLYNLRKDPIEMTNLASAMPDLVTQMATEYMKWDSEMMQPRWEDAHEVHQVKDHKMWNAYRGRAAAGEKNKKCK